MVSKSGIIDREPQKSDLDSQELPNSVQELIKVLTAVTDGHEKGPTGKREISE